MKINKKNLKHGSASIILTALIIAMVIVINAVIYIITDRFPLEIDLTQAGKFTLSEQTEEILDGIEEDINIYILSKQVDMEKKDSFNDVLKLIQEYSTKSGGKIKYECLDPYKNPWLFEKYTDAKGTDIGSLVITSEKRYTVLRSSALTVSEGTKTAFTGEQKLTQAIAYVGAVETSAAGFVSGHDEIVPDIMRDIFRGNSMQITSDIDLRNPVPVEVNNLVIAAPKLDYSEAEIKNLEEYLSRPDNDLFVFWSVDAPTLPVLERFLGVWGFEFPTYALFDNENSYSDSSLVLLNFSDGALKNEVKLFSNERVGDMKLVAPFAREIRRTYETKDYFISTPVAETYGSAFGKPLNEALGSDVKAAKGDPKGPFEVVGVTINAQTNSQVFVFGSEYFAVTDTAGLAVAYNTQMLNDLVRYANPDSAIINIAPKITVDYDMDITEGMSKGLTIVLLVYPVLILAAGIVVFIRRRRK